MESVQARMSPKANTGMPGVKHCCAIQPAAEARRVTPPAAEHASCSAAQREARCSEDTDGACPLTLPLPLPLPDAAAASAPGHLYDWLDPEDRALADEAYDSDDGSADSSSLAPERHRDLLGGSRNAARPLDTCQSLPEAPPSREVGCLPPPPHRLWAASAAAAVAAATATAVAPAAAPVGSAPTLPAAGGEGGVAQGAGFRCKRSLAAELALGGGAERAQHPSSCSSADGWCTVQRGLATVAACSDALRSSVSSECRSPPAAAPGGRASGGGGGGGGGEPGHVGQTAGAQAVPPNACRHGHTFHEPAAKRRCRDGAGLPSSPSCGEPCQRAGPHPDLRVAGCQGPGLPAAQQQLPARPAQRPPYCSSQMLAGPPQHQGSASWHSPPPFAPVSCHKVTRPVCTRLLLAAQATGTTCSHMPVAQHCCTQGQCQCQLRPPLRPPLASAPPRPVPSPPRTPSSGCAQPQAQHVQLTPTCTSPPGARAPGMGSGPPAALPSPGSQTAGLALRPYTAPQQATAGHAQPAPPPPVACGCALCSGLRGGTGAAAAAGAASTVRGSEVRAPVWWPVPALPPPVRAPPPTSALPAPPPAAFFQPSAMPTPVHVHAQPPHSAGATCMRSQQQQQQQQSGVWTPTQQHRYASVAGTQQLPPPQSSCDACSDPASPFVAYPRRVPSTAMAAPASAAQLACGGCPPPPAAPCVPAAQPLPLPPPHQPLPHQLLPQQPQRLGPPQGGRAAAPPSCYSNPHGAAVNTSTAAAATPPGAPAGAFRQVAAAAAAATPAVATALGAAGFPGQGLPPPSTTPHHILRALLLKAGGSGGRTTVQAGAATAHAPSVPAPVTVAAVGATSAVLRGAAQPGCAGTAFQRPTNPAGVPAVARPSTAAGPLSSLGTPSAALGTAGAGTAGHPSRASTAPQGSGSRGPSPLQHVGRFLSAPSPGGRTAHALGTAVSLPVPLQVPLPVPLPPPTKPPVQPAAYVRPGTMPASAPPAVLAQCVCPQCRPVACLPAPLPPPPPPLPHGSAARPAPAPATATAPPRA